MPDLPETNTVTVLRQKTGNAKLDELLDTCVRFGIPVEDGEYDAERFMRLVEQVKEKMEQAQTTGRDLTPQDIPTVISECRKTMSPSVWFELRYARYDYRKAGQPE